MAVVGSQLNEILETLASIQKTITFTVGSGKFLTSGSITDAFAYPQADPSAANTPFFYNEYAGAPKVEIAAVSGMYGITENFDMVLCVTPVTAELQLAFVYKLVAYWRDAVLNKFAANLRLGNALSYILDARITKISAFQKITIGTAEFGALSFTLTVRELFNTVITP